MLFVIHCLDKPDSAHIRRQHFEDHKTYLANAAVMVLVSGPLVAADHQTPVGSLFIIEAESLADAERLKREDPFFKAGLWSKTAIHPFLKRVDNRA